MMYQNREGRLLALTPLPKMMRLKPTTYHPSIDITAQAELQPQAPGVSDNLPLHTLADVYHMADPVGPPGAQQHEQLLVGAARLGLGEVQRDAQPGGRGPRPLEGGLQGLYAAPGGIAAQVDPHDATVLEGDGQVGGLQGLWQRVAPVDRDDESGVEGGGGILGGLELADHVQDGCDVARLGEVGPRQCPWCRAQLHVDDAVPCEVPEHGEGCVSQGLEVVDEMVDVRGEQGKEALSARGELRARPVGQKGDGWPGRKAWFRSPDEPTP